MRTARSFVRLAISGLILGAVAVACTVEEAADPCTPGETQKCDCKDGTESIQVCRDDGEKFGACDCPSDPGAGGNANGSAGEGSGVGGDGTKPTAGTGNAGGESNQSGTGGAGGEPSSGGATSSAGAGGDGGGEELPAECTFPADPTTCEICYFGGCCNQWAPCVNDDECLAQFTDVLACTDAIRATRNVTTADLEDCAQEVGETTGSWSASLSPLTVDLVDCVAGAPDWEGKPWDQNLSCKAECFDKE